ncbi:MAG: nucleotidyltransferase domain-containing protein [Deltaproteobacteria bacterium]|nr:nucleotidyltransferase domain-containing protein [Deltaproteobacteria bacterium]
MPSFIAEKSLNSVKVFWLDQERLLREIRKAAKRVGKEDENVLKIVLFGSLAERTGVPGSDADILILLEDSDKPFLERIHEWHKKFVLNFPLEVFPYTEKEQDNPLVQEAMRRGITLFER